MSDAILKVHPVHRRSDHWAFCELPFTLYRSDPCWVAPLRLVERRRWSPEHNASLLTRWVQRFLVRRGREVVGRVAVVRDKAFADRWVPGAGFFGFFECRNDPEAAQSLLTAAEDALQTQGATCVVGPVNLTTHDEVGLLVEGFDSRPTVLSPYNPTYYPALLEQNGYRPYRDYHAYLWHPQQPHTPAVERIISAAARRVGIFQKVITRAVDVSRWNEEVKTLHVLYNLSFANLWGFVPISLEEFAERAESFRPFFDPKLLVIAEANDQAVGFGLVLPDINQVLVSLRGRVLPFGWLRLLRGIPRIRSGRFILMGILPEYAGRGLAPLIVNELQKGAASRSLQTVEISLVSGLNQRMLHVVEAFGCTPAKRFRLFDKLL